MSIYDAKIGGVGSDGCMCNIQIGDCPVHYPEPARERHKKLLSRLKRSIAAANGWKNRKRHALKSRKRRSKNHAR